MHNQSIISISESEKKTSQNTVHDKGYRNGSIRIGIVTTNRTMCNEYGGIHKLQNGLRTADEPN